MIHREAAGNRREINIEIGELQHQHPDIRIRAVKDRASFSLNGGIGYVPITITGLTSPSGYTLTINDEPLDQSVHGNDFWQTDYDADTKKWSQTFNVPVDGNVERAIRFEKSTARPMREPH